MNQHILVRDEVWRVESTVEAAGSTLYQLRSDETGQKLTILAPPDELQFLPGDPLSMDRRALSPFGVWQLWHELIKLATDWDDLISIHAGRVQLEPYQLVPVTKILAGAHRNLLIADDVGLGKTIEAGLCLVEMIARGVGQRVLLVVPPGLIDQWVDEMQSKFGLAFKALADSASLDQAQTELAEGISPWAFHDRVITSVEYLKRPGVHAPALRRPWDVIVVDEAHYLAESGSPANPYATQRTNLGTELRKAARSLLLLTATPHNGYRHSFRSLLELVEPTDAALVGDEMLVRRRVERTMVRRLKQQITRSGPEGIRVPAFAPRDPIERIDVRCDTEEEREVFRMVARYCSRTAEAAAESDQRDVVSFAMQIVKKRMLSSRLALLRTIEHRLEALKQPTDEMGPTRAEIRELQSDLPLPEKDAERIESRVLRSAVPTDTRRRNAEKRQVQEILRLLNRVADHPDPKITRLLAKLRAAVIDEVGEKAIVFTEYRDTLEALRIALNADSAFAGKFVELPGGLTATQRRDRMAAFASPEHCILLATDAASEGLNLQQHCRRLYHCELPWNPNRLEQRNGRIDRHGQLRTPRISYLFYADSPEDRVLDRLIFRISQMQSDRVSTPDIIGLIETTRLPERLLAIANDEDAEHTGETLVRVFDEEHGNFQHDLAPLLSLTDAARQADDSTSADPILQDDLALERAMLRLLGSGARASGREHEYNVTVPIVLQGPGVADRYAPLTFRRSVALGVGRDGTEFVHRLHPLTRAAAVHARQQMSSAAAGVTLPPYLAVRRLPALGSPAALFTFTDRSQHPDGAIITAGLGIDFSEMPEAQAQEALSSHERPGDIPWPECEHVFADVFAELRSRAEVAVRMRLKGRIAAERERRARLGSQLRIEVDAYRADRMKEIDREEAVERAGTRDQTELFRRTQTDWSARRAAVSTQADARISRIAGWEAVPDPGDPQPLGVLLVFPGEQA